MADDDPRIRLAYVLQYAVQSDGSATERVRLWQQVLAGLRDGTLRLNSGATNAGLPPWVTFEVDARGNPGAEAPAAGALHDHERTALSQLDKAAQGTDRAKLNLHFLAGAGRSELEQMLEDGRFRVNIPEEAALLVAVWLFSRSEFERAAMLLEAIAPYLDRLRFYPVPHLQPRTTVSGVHLQSVGDTVRRLRAARPNDAIDRMREAHAVWAPLYERIVALFLETVEGEPPNIARTESGALARGPRGELMVIGGWPCRRVSPDWIERARALLADYHNKRLMHRACRKHEDPKENFARLRGYLDKWGNQSGLTAGEIGAIRNILAAIVARRGLPNGARWQTIRAAQQQTLAPATHYELAHTLAERFTQYPRDEGLATLDGVLESVSRGRPVPEPIRRKTMRCLQGSLPLLVNRRVFTSSESLGDVLAGLGAQARSAKIADPALRRVFEATYRAFRQCGSHARTDLPRPPKFGDLPWMQAVAPWVGTDETAPEAVRATLCEVTLIALHMFPYSILPNKLVRELRMLSAGTAETLPLVDEQPADIFTGHFSEQNLRAAQTAARMLRGSLYERYYGLPFERVLELNDIQRSREGVRVSPGFAELCVELTGANTWSRSLARNGAVLEQAQILTTHNLAVLFEALGLARGLNLAKLARSTFEWICRRQRTVHGEPHVQLRVLRRTAHAWRQMLFYLSLIQPAELEIFLAWTNEHMTRQRPELRERLGPVVAGLHAIAAGAHFDETGHHHASGARRFLGWTTTRHWLLSQRAEGQRLSL